MNDKSKDTVKARQDLQRLGIRSRFLLGQTKNEKCLKPQATYYFTLENQKKFCQFIKGVKLPDGFGSCFKHKVTDNDTNITGLKSQDCHIMMQHFLPYGHLNYLPDKITKPIIELCSLFKQICFATLMEDDMLKAQIKVVDILWDLELIYPPALFDIMIYLVIHLPLKALEGGPICPQWMFSFERYMKNLKDNDKDPEVSTTSELFALACGPTCTPILINSYVVDGVRYVMHSRDERRITQNSSICSPGPDGEMYYGQLQEILEFMYLLFKVVLFRVKWFNTYNQGHGQSTEVDVPPDIIDVVDEDDDITDDEDVLPYDLADIDNEDLINMSADVVQSHDGDGGGKDRPLHTMYPAVTRVALLTETQFDLRPHMEPPDWTEINAGIQQHLKKAYNTNKAAFKDKHWVIDPRTGTYNMDKIRRARPENITASEWDKGRPQVLRSTRRSLTPSSWHTLLTGNSFMMRTNVYTVLPARATASQSTLGHESTLNSLHKKVDSMMSLFKSDSKYSDVFSQFESGGASRSGECRDEEEGANHQDDEDKDGDGDTLSFLGDMSPRNMCHHGTYFLTGKYVGATVSPGLSLGKESLTSVPHRPFPDDKSSGKPIPSDKSSGKAGIYRWGRGLILFSHNACVAAAVNAMNSDSHDDSATVACFCVL
nr:hypothetical protein [Tanacetum cinerariifolium]